MDALIGVVGTLLGVVAGGLLSHLTTRSQFEHERRWQRDQLLQQRLGEIAEIAELVGMRFFRLCNDAIVAVESGQPLKPAEEPIPLGRLKMLTEFYAPDLRPQVATITEVRDQTGEFVAQLIPARAREKADRQQLNLQFARGMTRMNAACEALAQAAAQLGRQRLGIEPTTES